MQLIGRVTGPPATDKGGPHKIAQVTASLSVISTLYTIPISLSLNHNLPSPSCRQYDPPKALTTRARGGNQRRIQCGHIYLEIYVRTMSALCPHDISRRIYVSLAREMLCGHCADIYLQGYMSAQTLENCFFPDKKNLVFFQILRWILHKFNFF